ncbi:DNA phosphorothioation-dependent restriction protein DptF [Photobacterium damselae]|uniref:DNA phosphorothioation-dependent restriction protein DptF n=1 Tax=Photobacterium damselae TaxID=38293 RepID=UPI001592B6AE|nr:DNA phosphorothioation-dependent restriction protein DptF [Photobacterium damselae]MCG9706547.1 DNA phosphorothioation-dependent restriction protein DptF [Photobacterium damselae]MDC4170675.1 DNA phosphorothioation-dependent restriction protein DptF [Photobacterium damselae]NVH52969.1 DNA phosphorothioation-dependent restriction protein DptF [Photobacterium damselae subsp. damselae]NVO80899.1 DNA phosphorothioation-dependent restriction protein DptF [Photobacterium damselae subsp. damselae]
MKLIEALSILSKSSPYAVSTEREDDLLTKYKTHIYIKTDIEEAFKTKLTALKSGDILFLCGSSGDGKSEILTRYSHQFKSNVDFHLDATHSFSPHQTAIQALNERFAATKQSKRPLVLGINIGMLGNFSVEGDDAHNEIKESIKGFLENVESKIPLNHVFLDFEKYPKFSLERDVDTSTFVSQLLSCLTEPTLDNPFYALYDSEVKKLGHSTLTANYALLGLDSVQRNIIALLLKARLIKDQFLTTRALLDFIFQILAMDNYLFDNLFSGADNELLEHIQSFDPSNIHTRKIDEFVLQFGLGIENEGFTQLKQQVKPLGVSYISNAASYLRMVYLLKDEELFANEYINNLKVDFDNSLVNQYANTWLLHREFDGSAQQRRDLNKFYKDILIAAIHRYCNRNFPTLDKDQFFISEYNGFKTAVELEVKPDFESIQKQGVTKIGAFNSYIKVDDHSLLPMPISINLLELLEKINQGYRPNKHDKNAVLLLDEVIEQIITVANEKNTLFILKNDKRYKIVNEDDDYFEVSGI